MKWTRALKSEIAGAASALKSVITGATPALITVIAGAAVVGTLFFLGIGILILLNTTFPSNQFRDIGLIFGAAIAAVGAITAAFVAFQAGHHLEAERDVRERRRRIDDERTKAEAAIVTLHVVATYIDGIYAQVRKAAEHANEALKRRDFSAHRDAVRELPDLLNPFPLIRDLDVRFMRLEEQTGIRSVQVCLDLLANAIKATKNDVSLDESDQERLLAAVGETSFFGAMQYRIHQVQQSNESLFKVIVPYINQRRATTNPDESKLHMLLGDLGSNVEAPVTCLNGAAECIRKVAAQLLREHVHAKDLRSMLKSAAESIKDEDTIPMT